MQHNRGYILVYTVLVLGVMLTVVASLSRSALSEYYTSRDAVESAKAFAEAEAAIECLLAHDLSFTDYYPFDTMSPVSTVTCFEFVGSTPQARTMQVGNIDNDPQPIFNCKDENYTPTVFQLGSGSNPCSKTTVEVTATLVPGFVTRQCDVRIVSEGYNNCTDPSVQRVRWTHLVPAPLPAVP